MKGILFKPDMIQAAIEGRKTNTRRAEAGLKGINQDPDNWILGGWDNGYEAFIFYKKPAGTGKRIIKPRYQVGETVYIKEAYCHKVDSITSKVSYNEFWYRLDNPEIEILDDGDGFAIVNKDGSFKSPWQSPLFMPEWAARHFITITGVRADRLTHMSDYDAQCEGVHTGILGFAEVWNSINPKYPWESNPWVFPYTFRNAALRQELPKT